MTQRQGTNGRLRNVPLDERAFRTVFDVRRKIEEWRLDYNVQPAHIVQSIDVEKVHRALFEKLSLTVIRGLVMGAASQLVHAESWRPHSMPSQQPHTPRFEARAVCINSKLSNSVDVLVDAMFIGNVRHRYADVTLVDHRNEWPDIVHHAPPQSY